GSSAVQPFLNIVGEGQQCIRMGVLRQLCPLCLPPQSFFFAPLKFTPDLLKHLLCFAITGSVDRKLGGNPLTLTFAIYLGIEDCIVIPIFLLQASCYHMFLLFCITSF